MVGKKSGGSGREMEYFRKGEKEDEEERLREKRFHFNEKR